MRTKATVIVSGLMFLALFLFVALLDYVAAVTLFPKALVFFAALGVLFGALSLLVGERRTALVLTASYLVALVLLRVAVLSPVKPFRTFYGAIEPGMSRAAILGELDRQFPERGRFPRPAIGNADGESLWLTLDLRDGRYNSELVRVELVEGRAVEKEYYPD